MKKTIKLLTEALLFAVTAFSAFAQTSKLKVDSSKIIVIGKINVVYDEDREFIYKTRGIPEEYLDKADTYVVPYISDPNDTWGSNYSKYAKENQLEYNNGDFFIIQYAIPKKGEKILRYRDAYNFFFYSSVRAKIYLWLPDFDIDIPDYASALYMGSFTFYVTGDNFTIERIDYIDEYDLAQEELDRALGTHCDLARAVLREVE